jgi:hypothetical protein
MKVFADIPITFNYWQELKEEMQSAVDNLLLGRIKAYEYNQTKKHLHINNINKRFIDLSLNDIPIYSHIPSDTFLANIPKFQKILNDFNLIIKTVSIFIIGECMPVHVDRGLGYKNYKEYLNKERQIYTSCLFPIYNTENTVTSFYNILREEAHYTPNINDGPIKFNDDDIVEFASITINKPTIVRTDIPHGVKNFSKKPRCVFSVKFTSNPWIQNEII